MTVRVKAQYRISYWVWRDDTWKRENIYLAYEPTEITLLAEDVKFMDMDSITLEKLA